MALANIACLLAQRQSLDEGRGVLLIDWDLEAPGLHRYFRDKFSTALQCNVEGDGAAPSVYDQKLDLQDGLIDLFVKLEEVTRARGVNESLNEAEPQDEETARRVIESIDFDRFVLPTDIPSLSMMKAGRFDDGYAARVSTFPWEALYNRSPWLIRSLAEYLAEHYDFILIDSPHRNNGHQRHLHDASPREAGRCIYSEPPEPARSSGIGPAGDQIPQAIRRPASTHCFSASVTH